jgi:cysteine desulfurase/selenocysteine lyase
MKYLGDLGMENIARYEDQLLSYAMQELGQLPGIRFYGTADHKASLVSFVMDNIHPYDAGMIIDKMGIAVRTGHHCAMPLMDFLKIPGTVRASFSFYNNFQEIDQLVLAVKKVREMFA